MFMLNSSNRKKEIRPINESKLEYVHIPEKTKKLKNSACIHVVLINFPNGQTLRRCLEPVCVELFVN